MVFFFSSCRIYRNSSLFEIFNAKRSPWNEKTLLGWMAVMVCTIFTASFYYIANGMFLFFFFGICEHNQAFHQQFRAMLNRFNAEAFNYRTTQTKLCELVNFHVRVRK